MFVVYDVPRAAGFWLLVNDYLDALGDTDWEDHQSLTLRIPESNLVTREGLLSVLAQVRRTSFIHEAPGVIAFMETPSEDKVYDEHFWVTVDNPYRQPLPAPDPAIRDLALARCILCENYFWIDESVTDGHDKIEAGEDMPENLDFTHAPTNFVSLIRASRLLYKNHWTKRTIWRQLQRSAGSQSSNRLPGRLRPSQYSASE